MHLSSYCALIPDCLSVVYIITSLHCILDCVPWWTSRIHKHLAFIKHLQGHCISCGSHQRRMMSSIIIILYSFFYVFLLLWHICFYNSVSLICDLAIVSLLWVWLSLTLALIQLHTHTRKRESCIFMGLRTPQHFTFMKQ